MVELVDTLVSEASAERLGGSSPPLRTMKSKLRQQIQKKTNSNARIVAEMGPWRLRVAMAHTASLILGMVAALLGVVIGPAVQILMTPDKQYLPWGELLGPVWSGWLSHNLPGDGIAVSELYGWIPGLLVAIATLKSFLTFWQWYTWEWIGERLAFGWRQALVDSFIKLSPTSREQVALAEVESELGGLMTQDIRTCRDYVVHFFGGLPREGLQALFMAISIAALSPKLFFVFALCLAPLIGILGRLGRKIRRRATRALEDNSVLGEWIQQRLLGIETIKQLGTEGYESQAMKVASFNLFRGFVKAARVKARTGPMIEILGVIAMAVALAVAFGEISSGRLSGAIAMSFFASLALFSQSAAKLGRYFNSNREGLAAADRIFSAIDYFKNSVQEKVRDEALLNQRDQPSIRLRNVSVHYGSKIAVDKVTHDFLAGRVYCIVGSSGAGKSSLFAGILGLRKIDSGSIEYCVGPNFNSGVLDISYMPQAVTTLPGSIAENVSYPNEVCDLKRVEESLKLVGFSLEGERTPKGVETLVGPAQLQLSGGQAQRLQLARLQYHRSPMVLIDEGTSALDPELEKIVLSRARQIARDGAVVVMVAHRPAAVEFADELIVMREGKIARVGTREEVMASAEFKSVFG